MFNIMLLNRVNTCLTTLTRRILQQAQGLVTILLSLNWVLELSVEGWKNRSKPLCSHLHDKCHNVVCRQGTNINNIVFMCNSHYIDCLIKELGIDNSLCNPAYNLTTLSIEENVDNQVCFVFLCQALEFQPKMRCWIYC